MLDAKAAIEKIIFDNQTTYLTDYRKTEIKAPVLTKYKEKPMVVGIRPKPLKNLHTMTDWTDEPVPFSLMHQSRVIIDTNPWIPQKKYERSRPTEQEHALAVKTRPRLVMTPAVSMDDIWDAHVRHILCDDAYTTDATRGQREAIQPYTNVQAPFPPLPAPANPIFIPKLQPPLVSPEWRMETIHWDNKQLRAYCNPTREFWLRYKEPKCRACDDFAIMKKHRNMLRQQMKQN